MTILLTITLLLIINHAHGLQTQQFLIYPCRISQVVETGEFANCEKVSECIDDPPPSAFDKCKTYGYVQTTNSECRSLCCPLLEQGNQDFTVQEVAQCIDDWQLKQAQFILAVIFGSIGGATILLILGALKVYGFTKNPYTGKLVWTGVLCCRKQVDFKEQYEAGVTHKNLDKEFSGPMVIDPSAVP